jgi:hypothetical protein
MMCQYHINSPVFPADTNGHTPWHYSSRRTNLHTPFRNLIPNVPVKRYALPVKISRNKVPAMTSKTAGRESGYSYKQDYGDSHGGCCFWTGKIILPAN